jgi:hypothetical protein
MGIAGIAKANLLFVQVEVIGVLLLVTQPAQDLPQRFTIRLQVLGNFI